MKRLTLLFLAMLFPLAAHAVIRSQVYTTNGEPAVDAHVIALITGPTNGISLATATNVINGMATTLSVLHSTNADNASFSTNAAPGGNITTNWTLVYTNPVFRLDTNRMLFLATSINGGNVTTCYWNSAIGGGRYTNGTIEAGIIFDSGDNLYEVGPAPLDSATELYYSAITNLEATINLQLTSGTISPPWLPNLGAGSCVNWFPTNSAIVVTSVLTTADAYTTNTVYVDPNGNDYTGIPGYKRFPFKTLTTALRFATNSQNKVLLAAGHYSDFNEAMQMGSYTQEGRCIIVPSNTVVVGAGSEVTVIELPSPTIGLIADVNPSYVGANCPIVTQGPNITLKGFRCGALAVTAPVQVVATNMVFEDIHAQGVTDGLNIRCAYNILAQNCWFQSLGDACAEVVGTASYDYPKITNSLLSLKNCYLACDNPINHPPLASGTAHGMMIGLGRFEMSKGTILVRQLNNTEPRIICVSDGEDGATKETNGVPAVVNLYGVTLVCTNLGQANYLMGTWNNTRISYYDMDVPTNRIYYGTNGNYFFHPLDSSLTNLYVGTTSGRIPVTSTAGRLTTVSTLLYDSTLNQMIINENAVVGPVTIVGTGLAVKGADGQPIRINTSSFGVGGVGAYANAHARGTAGAPAAVQSGDQLMSLEGLGYVETDYSASPNVMMRGYAANTYNPSNQGSYMQFWITATNSIVPRVALTIDAAGRLNGDGTGLSNVTASAYPAPSLPVFTNLNSGELYSNVTATPILIIARAEARFMDTLVGVASTAEIDLVVNGLFTNSVSIDRNNGASTSTTGGHTATLSAVVPTNTFYWFTNVSVGAGGNPTGFVYQPIIIMPQR